MKGFLWLFLCLSFGIDLAGAQDLPKEAVKDIVTSLTQQANFQSLEKAYVQTDKPYYTTGDTLWFKAYVFNAAYLTASAKSGILYVEIANSENTVVKRFVVSLYAGVGWGNVVLNEKEFPQGNYTLRAYTNWMRNFDEHYIFQKPFYISGLGANDLLIKSRFNLKQEAGKRHVAVNLRLGNTAQQPLILADVQLKVNEGSKVWYKDKLATAMDGGLAFNFEVPAKADVNKLNITLQALNKDGQNPVYTVPLILNRPENTDLQFMPEGGSLVAGVNTRVAFKALAEDGMGVNICGSVYDSKQQKVLSFQSTHLGMGSFYLKPIPGETYTAKIKLTDGSNSKPYLLPAIKSSGIILNVNNELRSDSLEVTIAATADMQDANTPYYLIGQARGIGCYGAIIRLNHELKKIKLSKMTFPTGIARFTLFNSDRQALNERIVYIDHNDHLRVNLTENKLYYKKRDSVGIVVTVTDKNDKPVQGSFSVAVTDDTQVQNDSLKNSSLKSTVLLTSSIKGNLEEPGYYFPQVLTLSIWQDLDNLLLAQGWVNNDWAVVFQPPKAPLYTAETSFSVKGIVTSNFNKPVEKVPVVLLSKKPSLVRDTVTGKDGKFNFTHIYPSDTAVYFIQTKNKNGKSSNVNIDVDEFKPPVFYPLTGMPLPWYVNIDSSRLNTISNTLIYHQELEKLAGPHILKEVNIKAVKVIMGSKNLNGDGGSDFAMDEGDMKKAGKSTLGDLLAENVKGFKLKAGARYPELYFIDGKLFHLVIDGVDVDFIKPIGKYLGNMVFGRGRFNESSVIDYKDYIKQLLDYFTAEDIKGIEVMSSGRYGGRYIDRFLDPSSPYTGLFFNAYIEVTTYTGAGPFFKRTPGQYIYRPISFCVQQQFYSPKYSVKTNSPIVDIRSAIYWSPNIITGRDGKAKISFYTADKPGTYTLLMDGCDMNGNIGSTRHKILVR